MKMKNQIRKISVLLLAVVFLFASCGGAGSSNGTRATSTTVLVPQADGTNSTSGGDASIDMSNSSEGYIMVKYSGSAPKIKIQISGPSGVTYTYTSHKGDYQTFPLSEGSGSYSIQVLENISGTMYSMIAKGSVNASIEDEFKPFLYPNQYSWFTEDSQAVDLGIKLSKSSADDVDYVTQVYNYVTSNISYDNDKAANVEVDYVPDIDETLDSGKGICFDYAALMTAMLRSQHIPTKLVVGYSGASYHAWISVYLKEEGWVDDIIEFDGKSWSLMDPTLASSNNDSTVKEYVGDGSNYEAKYHY